MTAAALTQRQRARLHELGQTRWWENPNRGCIGVPVEVFQITEGNRTNTAEVRAKRDYARTICAGCPVEIPCRDEAILTRDVLFRGGLTQHERRSVRGVL